MNCTREELHRYGIYQLRAIGREVGVKLPTTYRKDDLIDEIMRIVSGEKEPYSKVTRKGRPAMNYSNVNVKSGVEGLSSSLNSLVLMSRDEIVQLNSSMSEQEITELAIQNVKGLVLKCEDFYVVMPNVWEEEVFFLPNDVVSMYNLQTGDFVEAKAKYYEHFNKLVVIDVVNVNGQGAHPEIRERLAVVGDGSNNILFDLPLNSEFENKVQNTVCQLRAGDRALAVSNDKLSLLTSLFSLVKKLSQNEKNEVISVLINANPEHISVFEAIENVKVIAAGFGVDDKCQIGQFELAIKHIKRLMLHSNKNIVAVFVDIDSVSMLYENLNVSRENFTKLLKEEFLSANLNLTNSLTIVYGLLYNYNNYLELDGAENVKLVTLGSDMMRKCNYAFNIRESRRNEFQLTKNMSEFDNVIKDFVSIKDYNEQHLRLEQIVKVCQNEQELINELKKY